MRSLDDIAYSPWIAFATMFRRETSRYLKLAVQTIVAPFLSQLLFLAVFGGFYAARGQAPGEVPYLRFLAPGLVLSGAFLSALQNPLFSIVAMRYQDTLKDFCLYPIAGWARYLAFASSGALRGLLVGAMTWAAAGLFAGYEIALPAAFWAYLFLVSLAAASGGIAIGLLLDSFEKAEFVVGLVATPAMYLSGVFYDVRAASPILGSLARFDPLTAIVSAGRGLYLGAPPASGPIEAALALLLAAAFVASGWALMAREVGMKRG